jgi:hypothetical protein
MPVVATIFAASKLVTRWESAAWDRRRTGIQAELSIKKSPVDWSVTQTAFERRG